MAAAENPSDPNAAACIDALLSALDSYIPDPVRSEDKPFQMPIENVFGIAGRGTVVTGKIEQGIVRAGDAIEIVGLSDDPISDVVTQVEAFQQVLDSGRAGESVGCLLRKTSRDEVLRGQVLAVPGSIASHRAFEAEVYVLKKEEGGRHTPFFDGYAPQFFFGTTNVTGRASVLDGVDMAMPGDGVRLGVQLTQPIAIADGSRFAIREGGRTVGSGVVTSVVT